MATRADGSGDRKVGRRLPRLAQSLASYLKEIFTRAR